MEPRAETSELQTRTMRKVAARLMPRRAPGVLDDAGSAAQRARFARCLEPVGEVRMTRNLRGQIWSKLLVNERLERLQGAGAPLSLHGASGLADTDLVRAVSLGIVKVNVNTELRAAYFGAPAPAPGRGRTHLTCADWGKR